MLLFGPEEEIIMKRIFVVAVSLMCLSTVLAARGGGKPQAETLAVRCNDVNLTESCFVTATNLVAGKAYQLEVTTNCADDQTWSGTADSGGNLILPVQPVQVFERDIPGFCETNTFFFYLFTESSKKTQLKLVATTTYADTD